MHAANALDCAVLATTGLSSLVLLIIPFLALTFGLTSVAAYIVASFSPLKRGLILVAVGAVNAAVLYGLAAYALSASVSPSAARTELRSFLHTVLTLAYVPGLFRSPAEMEPFSFLMAATMLILSLSIYLVPVSLLVLAARHQYQRSQSLSER